MNSYKARPWKGLESEEVYQMIEEIGGPDVVSEFRTMIETTNEINFERYLDMIGLSFEYEESPRAWLGMKTQTQGDRVIVHSVELDGAAYRSGINAGENSRHRWFKSPQI